MTTGKSKIILGLLAMLGLPCTALANAGTPLMWGAFGHLALGNIFIGILEGNILRWRNSGKGYSEVAMMIGVHQSLYGMVMKPVVKAITSYSLVEQAALLDLVDLMVLKYSLTLTLTQ